MKPAVRHDAGEAGDRDHHDEQQNEDGDRDFDQRKSVLAPHGKRYAAAAQFTRMRLRKCIPSPNEHVVHAQSAAKKEQPTVSATPARTLWFWV
jgi:hypothetical protein